MKKYKKAYLALSLIFIGSIFTCNPVYSEGAADKNLEKISSSLEDKDPSQGAFYKLIQALKESLKDKQKEEKSIKIIEEEISIETVEGIKINGVFTKMEGDEETPMVIIVGGSGTIDRDATTGPNKPYKDIAWGLARNGIASYRYDKRSLTYPQTFIDNIGFTVEEEYIQDIEGIYKYFEDFHGICSDRIFVLGHSLGGNLIPIIGERLEGEAGLIIMAGYVEGLEKLMKEQVIYLSELDGIVTSKEKDIIEQMKLAEEMVNNLEEVDEDTLIHGAYKAYWEYLNQYDPLEEGSKIKEPVLVLQGERDYQVDMKQYKMWYDAFNESDNWSFKTYEKLNHIMTSWEGLATPEEYYFPRKVSEELIMDIVEWIENN